MYNFIHQILNSPWWVKIQTQMPRCVYYFGPFDNKAEAERSQSGYLTDLIQENPQGIHIEIKRGRPHLLTVCDAER